VYLLVEVFEFAACIAEEEFAFDPDSEAEDVRKEQSGVKRDALKLMVEDDAAPRSEEPQLRAQPETEREKDQCGDKHRIGDHDLFLENPFCRDERAASSEQERRGVSLSAK